MTSVVVIMIGRVVSHTTNQPGGRVHGQVKLATMSSNASPEIKVEPQVRLSILILSKTYSTSAIYLADS